MAFTCPGSSAPRTRFLPSARLLRDLGFTLYATRHTSRFLEDHGVPNIRLYKIHERRKPSLLESISPDRLDLIINVPSGYDRKELTDGYIIRRRATDVGIPLIPNLQIAELFVKTIASKRLEDLRPRAYDEYVRGAGKGPKARSGLVLESEDAGAGGSLAHADRTSGRPSMRDASPSDFRGGTRNPQNPPWEFVRTIRMSRVTQPREVARGE